MFFFIGAIFDMIYIVQVKSMCVPISKVMAEIVVFVFSVTLTLTFDLCSIFFVTRIAHGVLEYPCEVS